MPLTDGGYTVSPCVSLDAGTYTFPVVVDGSGAYSNGLGSVGREIICPDTIRELSTNYYNNGDEIPIEKIVFPYGMKSINAFMYLINLKSFYLPNTVTYFGGIEIGSGQTWAIDTIELPPSLMQSGRLNNFTVDNLIINSDIQDFKSGQSMVVNNLVFAEGVTKIPDNFAKSIGNNYAVIGNISLPSTLKEIGIEAFYNNTDMPQFELPTGIETVGKKAFYNCPGLVGTVEGVKNVGSGAFAKTSITGVTLADGVISVGQDSFSGYKELISTDLPDTITHIERSAFNGCSKLTSIVIPDSVESIADYAFYNTDITSVSLPAGYTVGTTKPFPTSCTVTYH